MSLILHIVRKDFLRLRGRIALWAAVLVAKVVHGFVLLAGDGSGRLLESANTTAWILIWLDVAVGVVLAAMLVQGDLLVGTRADWMTRPVSGGRLLAAKLTGAVLLFGVLPVAVWLPWWWHCGYGAEQMAWAAGETLGWQLLIVVPAMMMAALTDSLGRFFLWSVAMVAVGIMGVVSLSTTAVSMAFGTRQAEVGVAMAYVLVVVGALAAVGAHYVWRRYLRTAVAGVVGAGVALGVVLLIAGWSEKKAGADGPWNQNAERAAGATLAWERALMGMVSRPLRDEGLGRVEVSLRLDGVPASGKVAMLSARQTWRWAGGPTVVKQGGQFGEAMDLHAALGFTRAKPDAETERWHEDRVAEAKRRAGGAQFFSFPRAVKEGSKYFQPGATLPSSVIERLGREPAEYDAEVRFALLRAEVLREEPLALGGWGARAGAGLRVARAVRKNSGVALHWVETRPMFLGQLLAVGSQQMQTLRWLQMRELVVLQRAAGDARRVNSDNVGSSARVGTVEVQWKKAQVTTPRVMREGKWVPRDADWFSGAQLAVVDWVEEARFTRGVKVEKFLIEK